MEADDEVIYGEANELADRAEVLLRKINEYQSNPEVLTDALKILYLAGGRMPYMQGLPFCDAALADKCFEAKVDPTDTEVLKDFPTLAYDDKLEPLFKLGLLERKTIAREGGSAVHYRKLTCAGAAVAKQLVECPFRMDNFHDTYRHRWLVLHLDLLENERGFMTKKDVESLISLAKSLPRKLLALASVSSYNPLWQNSEFKCSQIDGNGFVPALLHEELSLLWKAHSEKKLFMYEYDSDGNSLRRPMLGVWIHTLWKAMSRYGPLCGEIGKFFEELENKGFAVKRHDTMPETYVTSRTISRIIYSEVLLNHLRLLNEERPKLQEVALIAMAGTIPGFSNERFFAYCRTFGILEHIKIGEKLDELCDKKIISKHDSSGWPDASPFIVIDKERFQGYISMELDKIAGEILKPQMTN